MDDPFGDLGDDDTGDAFDDDDPFSYSKSQMRDKSSFLSYSKDASSMGGNNNMANMSLKERAKLMLEQSKASSEKSAKKSAKKGRKKKTIRQSNSNNMSSAASSLRRSGGASDGSGALYDTPGEGDKSGSLSRTGVDDRWSSRFDEMDDDLGIDERDWETPQQRAAREAQEAAELAAKVEASSIVDDDGSMHRLSRSGFGGAIDDEPSSEEEEEELVDPLSMTVSQIKEINARNHDVRQRKLEKQRAKEAAEREAKLASLAEAKEALSAATTACAELVGEDEENGSLSTTLTAVGMEEALAALRQAMEHAETVGVGDTVDARLIDEGEDVLEQLEEILATQIVREGDVERLQEAMAHARERGKGHEVVETTVAEIKEAGNLHPSHPTFADAEALVQELKDSAKAAHEKAAQESRAVALQDALQEA